MKKNRVNEPPIRERTLFQGLLAPFTWLYGAIMDARNSLYGRELLKSFPANQFSVVVGNLTVGGTGKTPMVEYLIGELSKNNRMVALSRGYGRRSRGFVLASPDSTAAEIGDEPVQYYEKFGEKVKIAVCEDRVAGSRALHALFPDRPLLVLDDAFQHRRLGPIDTSCSMIILDPFTRIAPFRAVGSGKTAGARCGRMPSSPPNAPPI